MRARVVYIDIDISYLLLSIEIKLLLKEKGAGNWNKRLKSRKETGRQIVKRKSEFVFNRVRKRKRDRVR